MTSPHFTLSPHLSFKTTYTLSFGAMTNQSRFNLPVPCFFQIFKIQHLDYSTKKIKGMGPDYYLFWKDTTLMVQMF